MTYIQGRWSDMGTPSQNSVIFEKYFFWSEKNIEKLQKLDGVIGAWL
jgi:hypothetical protein